MVSLLSSSALTYTVCPQPGAMNVSEVYPGEVRVNVELQSQLDSDSIACSVETDTDTSCAAIITRDDSTITGGASSDTTVTRDVYTVTVTQTNDYGSTVNMFKFNGRTVLTLLLWVSDASNIHCFHSSQQVYCLLLT